MIQKNKDPRRENMEREICGSCDSDSSDWVGMPGSDELRTSA